MDNQLTLRIPSDLAARLAARARAARVNRSQVVRDALDAYLRPSSSPDRRSVKERLAPYVGALTIDRAAIEKDDLARTIRDHNWRD